MIDLTKYTYRTGTLASRIRAFIKTEVGPQPFSVTQLVRALMDIDPWFAGRNESSVRDGVNNTIRTMRANGELEVVGGEKRRRLYALTAAAGSEAQPYPVRTRRHQLIAAGIPAHEFAGINDSKLDEPADDLPSISLTRAFVWANSPQGKSYWEKWESLLA